jgi:hypothetical protein
MLELMSDGGSFIGKPALKSSFLVAANLSLRGPPRREDQP